MESVLKQVISFLETEDRALITAHTYWHFKKTDCDNLSVAMKIGSHV